MRYRWLFMTLPLFCFIAGAHAEGLEDDPSVDSILLDQPIGGGEQRIVVVRGPYVDPSLLDALRSPVHPRLQEKYYEVRVELRSSNHDPVLLASRLRVESGTNADKGSVVLDAFVEPGSIILAMAEGPDLYIWQIHVSQASTCWTVLQGDKPWALAAAAYRLDDKLVSMRLGRTEDNRLTVEVVEKLSSQHTLYEESKNAPLHFKVVQQWRENLQ